MFSFSVTPTLHACTASDVASIRIADPPEIHLCNVPCFRLPSHVMFRKAKTPTSRNWLISLVMHRAASLAT